MAEDDQDSSVIRELREQLKAKNTQIAELENLAQLGRKSVLQQAFEGYGLDLDKGAGKLAASAYDGDLDPEAVSGWLKEQGFDPKQAEPQSQQQAEPDPGLAQRQQAQQRSAAVQDASAGTSQKMSYSEHQQLRRTNPDAARQAFESGRVDLPNHLQGPAIPYQT